MFPVLEKIKFVQGNRVLLKFSEGYEYRVAESVYLELGLAIGVQLSPDLEERIISLKDFTDCRRKAMDLLSSRPLSVYQLKQKLLHSSKFSSVSVQAILKEMEELKYLDDEEYCLLYVEESFRLRPEHGPGKIKQKLLSRGLDRALIDATIREFSQEPEEEYETAKALALKKWSSYPDRIDFMKKKSRLYRFLAGRGFSSHVVGQVMRNFTFNGKGLD
ncbi:MAG: recombination regulator RecX [Lentisphaeraceae bacterium]|nr:recombination regulator RecX [Lentisphaeraceae bacterium]